jgi:hypothetical protein
VLPRFMLEPLVDPGDGVIVLPQGGGGNGGRC